MNLAIQDVVIVVKVMEDTLDTVYKIIKLTEKSPKWDVIWAWDTMDCSGWNIYILVGNYQALQLTWDTAKGMKDTEMRAQIGEIAAQINKFVFF